MQYLAIVWLLNCRRVNANPQLGRLMRYVFRRGMVLLYLGLIAAYGALGLVAPLVKDGTVSRFFYGLLFTSTILHYYYDRLIWKVRERSNQAGLGLASAQKTSRRVRWSHVRIPLLLKWSPAIVVLGLLFATDMFDPRMTAQRKHDIEKVFTQSLLGGPALPRDAEERSWLYSQFDQA